MLHQKVTDERRSSERWREAAVKSERDAKAVDLQLVEAMRPFHVLCVNISAIKLSTQLPPGETSHEDPFGRILSLTRTLVVDTFSCTRSLEEDPA